MGTILFVHGTGVRLRDYRASFASARQVAQRAGLGHELIECAWGDPLGVEFEGKSLPDAPTTGEGEVDVGRDLAQWTRLFDDPLSELFLLTIRDPAAPRPASRPGQRPKWQQTLRDIASYVPSEECRLLLERHALTDLWPRAFDAVLGASLVQDAFEASAHELPEVTQALARAVIAELHVAAVAAGRAGPSRTLRLKLYDRLVVDWDQRVYGVSDLFGRFLKRAATNVLVGHRRKLSESIALPVGDILLYQSRGAALHRYLQTKIERAAPPVFLVAHSLGGIACVDLLAGASLPHVRALVTVGSQAPLLYELGALHALKPPEPLPAHFPPWLNIYDRTDFLSYVAGRLFPSVRDHEVASGQPFPDSHGAYFGNVETWQAIAEHCRV